MDTSDPDITFDSQGQCNHCTSFDKRLSARPDNASRQSTLNKLVRRMKRRGRSRDYDCIVGLSGGCDSSYLVFKVVELGLRPLALHFDSGWNTETSVQNIERIVKRLDLDLQTIVCVWDEMRDLQRSFLEAGIVNSDIPQDHAFIAALFQAASESGVKYWISGHDVWGSESVMARAWRGHDSRDRRFIRSVHRTFGKLKLSHYPSYSLLDYFFIYPIVKRIRAVNLYDYIDYNKAEAKEFLEQNVGWRDYGGKHNESVFTRFFQGHYLPTKFGYDKRRAHLSSLVLSGQLTRKAALDEISVPFYSSRELNHDLAYVQKKLGISAAEWADIVNREPCDESRYSNSRRWLQFISVASAASGRLQRSIREWRGSRSPR